MAFTGITATEAQIDQLAGANIATAWTDTMKTESLLFWENQLNIETEYNWSDAFGSLNVDVKSAVTLYTASGVAQDAINYDSDAIGQSTAELRLDKLESNIRKALKAIKEKSKQAWAVDVT